MYGLKKTASNEIVIPYTPRPLQKKFHLNARRWNIEICHRRFGKTVMAINWLVRCLIEYQHKNPQGMLIAADADWVFPCTEGIDPTDPSCLLNYRVAWCILEGFFWYLDTLCDDFRVFFCSTRAFSSSFLTIKWRCSDPQIEQFSLEISVWRTLMNNTFAF